MKLLSIAKGVRKMSSHLKQFAIFCVALWLLSAMISAPIQTVAATEDGHYQISETDLDRVDWKLNHIRNPGMEHWTSAHDIDGVYTYRTTEHYNWYATAPWPVNEGSRSRGMQSRAIDPNHPGEAYVTRQSWAYWDNPTNLTMKFDWYIDSLPQPVDSDYFRLNIYLGSPSNVHIYYYFNCYESGHINSSNYIWFFLDSPAQTWNVFNRNITEDYFAIAGSYPTEFQQFRFEQRTLSPDYSRAFIDDLEMANGTIIYGGSIGNGNFETNSGWYSLTNYDGADISRSPICQEGDWSLNATAKSIGNQSRLDITYSPDRRLSSMNLDTFSFQWMMNEFDGANEDTFAYVRVSCQNDTDEFDIFYNLAYGDNTNSFTYEGALIINVTGFNTTGQWNSFERSIWDDIRSFNQTDYVTVDEIEIRIQARGSTSVISILFDDMQFESAAMDDMGYEDQGDVGDQIYSWATSYSSDPKFIVTDVAHSGTKAGNLTVINGDSWSEGRDLENRPVNNKTDLWLDFFWRIENDSQNTDNLLYLEAYFDSGESLGYILVNHTDVPTSNGFDEFIVLPDANTEDMWLNFHRNIYDDFVTAFGGEPDTELQELYLVIESDTGGKLEVLFDDVYLFNDPAPEISAIQLTPQIANQGVNVSAIVNDLSAFTVKLHYQIGSGSWTEVPMIDTGVGFNATIPGQTWETPVNFYIEATDDFGQTSESTHLSYLIQAEPEPTAPPDYLPLIVGVVLAVVVIGIVVVYYFIIRPKQGAE